MQTTYGREVSVAVGSIIQPDNWNSAHALESSNWDQAEFILPTGHDCGITHLAVNVTITGRDYVRRAGGSYWIRCRIVFVGDGTPDVRHSGWLLQV